MKALLAVPWDSKRGGVVAVVDNVATCLQAGGHDVVLFHSDQAARLTVKSTQLGFPGVELRLTLPFGPGLRGVLRTLAFPFLFPIILAQLIWLLRRRGIQIVNLHYPIDNFVYFAICRHLLPIRLVTSVHGRDAFRWDRALPTYSRAFRFIVRSSDLIVLPSESYRGRFVGAFPASRDKTVFIHNSINPAQFAPAVDGSDRRGDTRYILCVAVLREDKAIDVLLHAVQPLLQSDPSLWLVLVGDGPLRQDLESLASSLGIRHRTMFLGTQGESEIINLLHGCEVKVMPSRMEPFGIAIIEAMACRKPVVASAIGGIPEIIEHGVSGLLVEPEDPGALTAALRRLLADPELRKRLAENGYARVMQRFCSAHNGAAYTHAFSSLLEMERPTPQSPPPIHAMDP
jgi:glycosyltransferase involved in cell wall biosynthesis